MLLKMASPEVARFNGMKFMVYYDDHVPPHFHVEAGGDEYRLQFDLTPVLEGGKGGTLSSIYTSQIKNWFVTPVGNGKEVRDLMYEQWLLARNHKPTTKVPTPQELANQKNKKASYPKHGFYAVENVTPIKPFKLRVEFSSGECKIVDIRAMRGNHPMFVPIWDWEEFKKVWFAPSMIAWFEGINELEIEDQDLWAAGEPCVDTQ